ncbi:dTDP-4-dehydrorhamnose 3,5-epimerase [Sphingomonas sp. HDW15A]|uniref:dTDP-4-dehydrorhamnose 3,5-epimerase n=1 Tax=Sphingomonas sp. HDW15A TaxID=2714942 RepID=UPI0019D052B1|nr:dTDP-4-dehydrorhamnose 3,5-epimerase [Sphingomonas sp. HDW15A]
MLEIRRLAIPDVIEIRTPRHRDERGFFSETWNKVDWNDAGIQLEFVQHNHSMSAPAGVLRGLHYQLPPYAQEKLIRVTRGAIFDVAVDIRRSSPTFGGWVGATLSAADWNQVLIPKGFAHGFLTLEPDTEVQYNVTAPYSPAHDRAIRYDDPTIGIDWPSSGYDLILSSKDAAAPLLADAELFA